jgi:hypothetical protein
VERPRLWSDRCFPAILGARFTGDDTRWPADVETFVDHDSARNQDGLAVSAPCSQFDHHWRHVFGERFERGPISPSSALHDQPSDMCSSFKSQAVLCPVIENAEAVRCVDFAELNLDAVIGVAIYGKDVQTSTPRGADSSCATTRT